MNIIPHVFPGEIAFSAGEQHCVQLLRLHSADLTLFQSHSGQPSPTPSFSEVVSCICNTERFFCPTLHSIPEFPDILNDL